MKRINNNTSPLLSGGKSGRRNTAVRALTAVAVVSVISTIGGVAFAAASYGDPIQGVNNLSDFIWSFIRVIGLILLGFGVVQLGLSFKSHDPSQRANGFLTLGGGIIIAFAKEIVNLIIGA